MPPMNLATAMPKFASPARITVPVLSPPLSCSGPPSSPGTAGMGGPGVDAESWDVTWGRLMGRSVPPPATAEPRPLPHADQVDDEHESGTRLDDAARAALAVGLVRR